jgi:signal transduction histidine kinase
MKSQQTRELPAGIPSIFQLAVGPQLTSFAFFAVTSAFALLSNFTLANDITNVSPVVRVLAVLASQALLVFVVGACYFWNRRAGSPIKPTWFIAAFLVAGALRGAFLEYLLNSMGALTHVGYAYRIWVGATNFGLAAWAWSALLGLAAEFAQQSRRLDAERTYLSRLQVEVDTQVTTSTEIEIDAFREYLLANLKLKPKADAALVREQLHHTINEVIRPIVTQMLAGRTAVRISNEPLSTERVSLENILRNLSVRASIQPLIQVALPLLATSAAAATIYSWPNAVEILLAMVVLWPSLLLLAKFTLADQLDRLPYLGRIAAIAALFFVTISPTAYLAAVFPAQGQGAVVTPVIVIYAVTVGLAAAFWRAYSDELNRVYLVRNRYLQQIRWKVAEVNSRSWHQQLHFARRVHGALQSEVAAMAIRLDQLLGKSRVSQAKIDELRETLEDRVRVIFDAPDKHTNLAGVLTEIAETWEGICQVTVLLTDGDAHDITRDQIAVETALEIVREAISNAIRHGKARNITVSLELIHPDLVRVRVENDGLPVAEFPTGKGMGSKHLDECTVEHSIIATERVTILLADVPFRG